MRDLGLDNSYIYRGYFCNFMEIGFYSGRVSGRVLDFFDKIRTRFGFFFLNPYPTLFLIGPGKTQPIRVGPGRVLTGRAKIAIPSSIVYDTFRYLFSDDMFHSTFKHLVKDTMSYVSSLMSFRACFIYVFKHIFSVFK